MDVVGDAGIGVVAIDEVVLDERALGGREDNNTETINEKILRWRE